MPPFAFQALLTAAARDMAAALGFLRAAREAAASDAGVCLFDPVPRVPPRLANVERAQLLIEANRRDALQDFLRQWSPRLRALKSPVRWQLEVDPLEI
jgi:primosomal protein N' (replication factor Y)